MNLIASGRLVDVVEKVKECLDQGETSSILIFDDDTSQPIEIDFRGTKDEVVQRLLDANADVAHSSNDEVREETRGRGRPKLGVVAREVTLLPRHWDWLNAQPGGASVAIRKLVETARRENSSKDRIRVAQEDAYRFMSSIAANLPNFEEATRALFARDKERFAMLTSVWPDGIRDHSMKLSTNVFDVAEQD
ncbi:MAG: DUF2239 family protein [Candidatus Obscuribacterales bacterium]|nr:DUF2239 family protein [Candidatus Obscuribacterales bacterium]